MHAAWASFQYYYTGMMLLSDGASEYIYGTLYVLLDSLAYTILLHRSIRLCCKGSHGHLPARRDNS